MERRGPVDLTDVLAALQRIQTVMSDRNRSQLLALLARSRPAASLDAADSPVRALADGESDPERALGLRELDELFASALAALPPEDAAIVRLTFVQGWSREEVRRALHLDRLTAERMTGILDALRQRLSAQRLGAADAATPGLSFLEDGSR
jgi:DNA-directed RNA polymerase specialized sigma24 family protein